MSICKGSKFLTMLREEKEELDNASPEVTQEVDSGTISQKTRMHWTLKWLPVGNICEAFRMQLLPQVLSRTFE